MSNVTFLQTIPIFRIFDVAKAKEFYVGFLGFSVAWEHTFDANAPVYMRVTRGDLVFHLSEHHGDACPGAAVFVWMTGIRDYQQELIAKQYKYYHPGVEETFYDALCMEVVDPFGNKIRFNEYKNTTETKQD